MYKIETTSKVSQKLTRKINLGRQGARAELSTLDTAHRPPTARKGHPRPIKTHSAQEPPTRRTNPGRRGARAEPPAQENDPPSPNTSPQYTTPTKERIATAAPLQRHHKAPAPIPERENQQAIVTHKLKEALARCRAI